LTYVVLLLYGPRTTPVAGFILLHPGVQFKSVESDALFANRNLGDIWSHLYVEPVAIHSKIEGGIPQAD